MVEAFRPQQDAVSPSLARQRYAVDAEMVAESWLKNSGKRTLDASAGRPAQPSGRAVAGRSGMDIGSVWGGCSLGPMEGPMRYKLGAEQLQQVPSLVHRPDGGVPGGQDRPGRPNPRRLRPRPVSWSAGSRQRRWWSSMRTGKRPALSRSARAASPPPPASSRCRDRQAPRRERWSAVHDVRLLKLLGTSAVPPAA